MARDRDWYEVIGLVLVSLVVVFLVLIVADGLTRRDIKTEDAEVVDFIHRPGWTEIRTDGKNVTTTHHPEEWRCRVRYRNGREYEADVSPAGFHNLRTGQRVRVTLRAGTIGLVNSRRIEEVTRDR